MPPFIRPLCLILGGFFSILAVYNQRHLVGVESSRKLSYMDSPYDSSLSTSNYVDSKTTRYIETYGELTEEGVLIDKVFYKCDYSPLFQILNRNKTNVYKARLIKNGPYITCKLIP